jgi:hypothetical protein
MNFKLSLAVAALLAGFVAAQCVSTSLSTVSDRPSVVLTRYRNVQSGGCEPGKCCTGQACVSCDEVKMKN